MLQRRIAFLDFSTHNVCPNLLVVQSQLLTAGCLPFHAAFLSRDRGADGKLVLAGAAFFHMMGAVALCMLRMAGEGLLHRDIKPANILVRLRSSCIFSQ